MTFTEKSKPKFPVLWGGLLMLAAFSLLGSCKDNGELADLARLSDQVSQGRLAALPAGAAVLLSLHGDQTMDQPGELGPNGTRLSSFDRNWLVSVPAESLGDLAAIAGLKSVVVWGDGALVGKLDSRLRMEMLTRISKEKSRPLPLGVEARFEGGGDDLRQSLEALGAQPRSVSAGIVTMDAPVDVLLEVLARPDLVSLSKPVLQKPLQGK